MRGQQSLLAVALAAALVASGCGGSSTVRLGSRAVDVREIQDAVRLNHDRIRSLQSEGRIALETPEMAQSGSFRLLLQKPDSLLLNFQGPFGIKVGTVLLTRTGFQFYNSFENKLISGPSNPENLRRILHLNLSFDDMLNLFAGGVFMAGDNGIPDNVEVDDDCIVLTYAQSTGKRIYWIDPEMQAIEKVQVIGTDKSLVLEQTFSDFQTMGQMVVPTMLRIVRPKERQVVSLRYSDVILNTAPLNLTFSVPRNAERVRW